MVEVSKGFYACMFYLLQCQKKTRLNTFVQKKIIKIFKLNKKIFVV